MPVFDFINLIKAVARVTILTLCNPVVASLVCIMALATVFNHFEVMSEFYFDVPSSVSGNEPFQLSDDTGLTALIQYLFGFDVLFDYFDKAKEISIDVCNWLIDFITVSVGALLVLGAKRVVFRTIKGLT